jgi:hypothetical protein
LKKRRKLTKKAVKSVGEYEFSAANTVTEGIKYK